jgi:ATP-dependent DNA ligase
MKAAADRAEGAAQEDARRHRHSTSESFEVDGQEMFKHACKTGLEGVVSKVRDGKYASGRINDWVKPALNVRH